MDLETLLQRANNMRVQVALLEAQEAVIEAQVIYTRNFNNAHTDFINGVDGIMGLFSDEILLNIFAYIGAADTLIPLNKHLRSLFIEVLKQRAKRILKNIPNVIIEYCVNDIYYSRIKFYYKICCANNHVNNTTIKFNKDSYKLIDEHNFYNVYNNSHTSIPRKDTKLKSILVRQHAICFTTKKLVIIVNKHLQYAFHNLKESSTDLIFNNVQRPFKFNVVSEIIKSDNKFQYSSCLE
jgi:hypothetical protein